MVTKSKNKHKYEPREGIIHINKLFIVKNHFAFIHVIGTIINVLLNTKPMFSKLFHNTGTVENVSDHLCQEYKFYRLQLV